MSETKKGVIVTLNQKGFGFIRPTEAKQKDIFFHHSGLIDVKFNDLEAGIKVCYVENEGEKGLKAVDIVVDYFDYADNDLTFKINKDTPSKKRKTSPRSFRK